MTPPELAITSVGTALPGEPIDNAKLHSRLGVSEEWISTFIGTKTRYLCVDLDSGRTTRNLTDLGEQAGAQALARANLEARDIDFVVLATATPDELMPATVNRVADRLGVDRVPTYQLQSGCAGAVQALDLGRLLLADPRRRTGLIIGGDVCAKHCDLSRRPEDIPSGELVNYVLFGDGAGAAVLTSEPEPGDLAVHTVLNQVTGLGNEPGQVVRWFGLGDRGTELAAFEEDYKAIESAVPKMTVETLWQLLDEVEWGTEDIDCVLPPQLSGRMTDRIVADLAMPEAREISCVADTGNNANALPFLQLDRLQDLDGPVRRLLGIAIEASKWIKSGFVLERI